jgi:hypothetical protein
MNTAEISLRCTDYQRALNSISQNQALRQGVHPAWNSLCRSLIKKVGLRLDETQPGVRGRCRIAAPSERRSLRQRAQRFCRSLRKGPPARHYRAEDLEGHRWMFLQRIIHSA